MRRIVKDLIVTVFGLVTSAATAYVLALIDTHLHFAFYASTLWLVFPIGAALSGAVAATGYYIGFQIFPHRPTWLLMINVIWVSIATYFLVYYIHYSLLEVQGRPVSSLMPFSTYLQIVLKNRRALVNGTDFGSLGPVNYILAAIQILGFAAGGWVVSRRLYSIPCCDHCDRKLKTALSASRFSNSLLQLEELFQKVKTTLSEGRSAEAVQVVSEPNPPKPTPVHRMVLTLWKCDRCAVEFFSLFITPGGDHVGHVRDYCPSRKTVLGASSD